MRKVRGGKQLLPGELRSRASETLSRIEIERPSRPLYYTAVDTSSKFDTPSVNGAEDALRVAPSGVAMPKMSQWRQMQVPIVAWAVYWLLRAIGPTLRVEIVGVHNAAQFRDRGEPAIGAFWHRCIFPAVWIWRRRGIVVLNTVNFDGQWTRRVIERLGFGTEQGSSTRGAIEGLSALAKQLERGRHVALTIDGPRGPRFVAKPGAVILARRTGRPISVFHMGVKWGHTFRKSWDWFRLPYPFSRVVMFVAPPIRVPMDADSETVKAKQAEVQAALDRVRNIAESWFRVDEAKRDAIRDEWREREPEDSRITARSAVEERKDRDTA